MGQEQMENDNNLENSTTGYICPLLHPFLIYHLRPFNLAITKKLITLLVPSILLKTIQVGYHWRNPLLHRYYVTKRCLMFLTPTCILVIIGLAVDRDAVAGSDSEVG